MAKKYSIPKEEPCIVSEPSVAFQTDKQTPPTRVKSVTMPCVFTDEEFKDELQLSEASGFVSNEEFKRSCLDKWGIAL